MKLHSKCVIIMIFLCIIAVPVFADAGSIAVLPYFSLDSDVSEEFDYAIFLVPDMIRIKLAESGRFNMVEAYQLEQAADEAGYSPEFFRDEENCLQTAKAVGLDNYIRGYLYMASGQLTVVHTLVSVEEGRVVHIEKQKLPKGRELVGLLEDSSLLFAEWINTELPDREPDIIVIERETIVEKETVVEVEVPVPVPVKDESDRTSFNLSVGTVYRFFLADSSKYLSPNFGVNIGFMFREPGWLYYEAGFRIGFDLLNQKPAFYEISNQDITVLHMPVMLSCRFLYPVLSNFEVFGGIDAGGAVIFGFVEPDVIAHFRPSAAVEAGIQLFSDSTVSLDLSAVSAASFFVYGELLLLSIAPSVKINFNF